MALFRSPSGRLNRGVHAGLVLALACAPAAAQRYDGRIEGAQAGAQMGVGLASGMDINGDFVEDYAIASPYYTRSIYTGAGIVQVFDGASGSLLRVFTGGSSNEQLGSSLALVNDLDGDGTGEICIGAPGWNGNAGFVAMYSIATGAQLWAVYGAPGAQLGFSVAPAGDVDHDHRIDVVVGAPGIDKTYVYGWNTGAIHTLSGSAGSRFGHAVAGNVDINGDATMDILVSAPYYDSLLPAKQNRGRVVAYSGATAAALYTFLGADANDYLGWAITGLGDVDGDGKAEVAASSPWDDDNGTDTGIVIVINSNGTQRYALHGGGVNNYYGMSLCGLPDMTRDGRPDLAVGATDLGSAGWVHLVNGHDGATLHTIFAADGTYDSLGFRIVTGDFNNDDSFDLLVADNVRGVGTIALAGTVNRYLAAPAYTQGWGSGWPGTLGVPTLVAQDDPAIGQTLHLHLSNSRGTSTAALLFVGFVQIHVPSSAGGTLLVSPFQVLTLPVPPLGLTFSGLLPNNTGLLLQEVDLQALEVDPGASHGLSFTAGLKLSIGFDYP